MKTLEFDNVSFAYADGRPVLENASFAIEEGEFVALVGKNGSGKSTIAKMADAFLLPSEGSVTVFERNTKDVAKEGEDALLLFRCDIGFVLQNPDNQFVASRVLDEVAFGPSGLGISKDEVIDRINESLEQVGATDLAERDVNTLSGGQKQRIAIADALAMRPKMFIFDEPTSMLDDEGRKSIMSIIRSLHETGATIILITHSAEEASYADRVLKVSEGQVRECVDPLESEDAPFQKLARESARIKKADTSNTPKEVAIRFDGVSFSYEPKNDLLGSIVSTTTNEIPVFRDFNLDVYEHELLCIAGPNGSGKSTLASLTNGLLKPTHGQIVVYGIPTSDRQGANAARRRVGVCFQYPERNFFCQTVLDEVAFGPTNSGHSKQEAQDLAKEALALVRIDPKKYGSESPFDLSGGLQRRVAFASILSMHPDVLVMDEPCAGLDTEAHVEFTALLLDLKQKGQTMMMITHDKRDIKILADKTLQLS